VEGLRYLHPEPWLSFADGIFTSAMLAIAIRAIRPRLRRADSAERFILISLGVFIGFEMLLVVLDWLTQFEPDNKTYANLFNWSFAIGLMPVFMTNGVAAVMLISADLARRLRTLADYDPLTGALNRRGFDDRAFALLNGRKAPNKLAIAVGDIDWFKAINDNFGHSAGDAMLRTIHDRMNVSLGNNALVARIGGEEFAILMATSSAEQAAADLDRVREDIAQHCSLPDRSVTMSFGLTMIIGVENGVRQSLTEAINRADTALYRSKIEGRNRLSLALIDA
jgi:diguanylate cyclase (GGDEF)-like protein